MWDVPDSDETLPSILHERMLHGCRVPDLAEMDKTITLGKPPLVVAALDQGNSS